MFLEELFFQRGGEEMFVSQKQAEVERFLDGSRIFIAGIPSREITAFVRKINELEKTPSPEEINILREEARQEAFIYYFSR